MPPSRYRAHIELAIAGKTTRLHLCGWRAFKPDGKLARDVGDCLMEMTQITEFRCDSAGKCVIGCVVTVDRMSRDTWPLSPRVIGTGCGMARPHGNILFAILTLTIDTSPSPFAFLCVYVPGVGGIPGVIGLAPGMKTMTNLTSLNFHSEWVIGCVVTVDRMRMDTRPISLESYRHGVWDDATTRKYFVCNCHTHH